MKFDKHQVVFLRNELDLRKSGGTLIPKGEAMTIQIRRRDGSLWVKFHNFDHRHVNANDVSNFTVNTVKSQPTGWITVKFADGHVASFPRTKEGTPTF